jgi:hypothetical protein
MAKLVGKKKKFEGQKWGADIGNTESGIDIE